MLARPDAAKLFSQGVELEQDLHDVVTHSVGQSIIGDHVFSYCGEQCLTQDGQGEEVHGGSNLLVVPGYYENLLTLDLPDDVRLAVEQAQVFDAVADEAYPGFYASRRNYDIAQGWDSKGQRRGGVLEQSWRMGGASSAGSRGATELYQPLRPQGHSCVLGRNLRGLSAAGGCH